MFSTEHAAINNLLLWAYSIRVTALLLWLHLGTYKFAFKWRFIGCSAARWWNNINAFTRPRELIQSFYMLVDTNNLRLDSWVPPYSNFSVTWKHGGVGLFSCFVWFSFKLLCRASVAKKEPLISASHSAWGARKEAKARSSKDHQRVPRSWSGTTKFPRRRAQRSSQSVDVAVNLIWARTLAPNRDSTTLQNHLCSLVLVTGSLAGGCQITQKQNPTAGSRGHGSLKRCSGANVVM